MKHLFTILISSACLTCGSNNAESPFKTDSLSRLSILEKITFNDNVAVVMGGEIIKPQGHQVNAGKTVSRRFTHVWLYKNNQWSLIARQATIIKIE